MDSFISYITLFLGFWGLFGWVLFLHRALVGHSRTYAMLTLFYCLPFVGFSVAYFGFEYYSENVMNIVMSIMGAFACIHYFVFLFSPYGKLDSKYSTQPK